MNVAILGRHGSGKTTLAVELMRKGYTRFSWADPVKEIARWAYGHVDKAGLYTVRRGREEIAVTGRDILQRIGTDAIREKVDADFWIKAGIRRIDAMDGPDYDGDPIRWVNDDTRFPNEVEALRSRGFLIVWIAVPDVTRIDRLGAGYNPVADLHPSETSVGARDADITVNGLMLPSEIAEQVLDECARRMASLAG